MKPIEISLTLHRIIELNRTNFDESENDILLRLLKSQESQKLNLQTDNQLGSSSTKNGFYSDGVLFPNGMKLHAEYKGRSHRAEIKNSRIYVDGQEHTSFSSAAMDITGSSVNGWTFWRYQDKEDYYMHPIADLRKKKSMARRKTTRVLVPSAGREFVLINNNIVAKGTPDGNSFTVLKGSELANYATDSCPQGIIDKREELRSARVTGIENGKMIFFRDYTFNSPSQAAGVVVGFSANGRLMWKRNGKSIKGT